MGPTLFVAAVHSLPKDIRSTIMIYADNTKLYRPVAMPRDAEQLQGDQDELVKWSERWQLPFNTAKCKVR